jgi:hypothetical protein
MVEYNEMPKNAMLINNYEDWQDYFTFCKTTESRQPFYNDNFMEGSFNLMVYWITKEMGLGYGIAKDWKKKIIKFYKFGSEENWNKFKNDFASQFRNDNS